MINKNIKEYSLVLFDWDDTLCIHPNHYDKDDYESNKNYDIASLQGHFGRWGDQSRPSVLLLCLLQKLSDLGIEVGLFSRCRSHTLMQMKEEWIKAYIPNVHIENYSIGDGIDKVEYMDAIAEAKELSKESILLIDNSDDILSKAEENGFHSASPIEAAEYAIRYLVDCNAVNSLSTLW